MLQLIDQTEKYLLIQPFKKKGIYLKRRGDRYLLIGNVKPYAKKLEALGYRFNADLRAWLMRPRKQSEHILQVVGKDLGMPVDMRKYAHLLKTERKTVSRNIKKDKAVEISYEEQVKGLLDSVHNEVLKKVVPILKQYRTQFEGAGNGGSDYLRESKQAIEHIKGGFNFSAIAKEIASKINAKSDKVNKERFIKNVSKAIGINIQGHV